jgi:hypothetical protein
MVLRGYDRVEVDQYIAELLRENAALRAELDGRPAQPVAGPQPQVAAREPAARAPSYDVDTPPEDSFGFRAEKLLRLAEREAAEMRTRATRDAETVEANSRRRAEEQLHAAQKEADEVRAQAAQDSARFKKQASQEAARLNHLHSSTKGELRRLAQMLNAELERPDPEPVPVAGEFGGPAGQNPGTPASNR